jgi:hypothetical protein
VSASVRRWVFYDSLLAVSWTVPFNPKTMSNPYLGKATTPGTISPIDGNARSYRTLAPPRDFTFGGTLRSQEHYDGFVTWAAKTNLILLTDHLGRQFNIRFVAFEPDEQKPQPGKPWFFNYTIKTLTYGPA